MRARLFLYALTAALGFGTQVVCAQSTQTTTKNVKAKGNDTVNEEIAFLQTLQAAQVSSMSCLIALVNMTVNPVGTCLGLSTLSELVVHPTNDAPFSYQLSTYLDNVCAGAACTDASIAEARAQLAQSCGNSKDTGLVKVISAILDNYTNSYRTLACSVHFNGTAEPCLPANLNVSDAANNPQFFNNLITGTNLDQYVDTVFKGAKCTGCMYELYKAAVYMIPGIRTNGITWALGSHLQNDCGQAAGVEWSNVQDQQIPDALQVQQNTGTVGAGERTVHRWSGLVSHILLVAPLVWWWFG